ncbi:MAG: UDP-N-acetylmuramoyl-L-alanyl-D-glutamate--2,6-diaminopimelate ligase [Alphaproteobacteria bacterium]|nr:UDP-N-acetylmuramoyl-L-alanyl-D-glutamate--2,6-diaminopimelate ligase [Alphaproteobacteria bacterium]
MTLSELFGAGALEAARDLPIAGLAADSRRVKAGFVFAALQGAGAHGRDYLPQALANGAVAVLSAGDVEVPAGVAHVVDSNPRRALALAAARFYPRQPATIAAVTGTNGKSSTVDFLRQIWSACGKRAASLGTLGAIGPSGAIDLGHTTPDPVAVHEALQRLADEGVTHAAMEASSHGLEQHRLDGVRLSCGAFTNLTQDHLDYHQTMEAYRAAKLRLWSLLPAAAPAVINADAADAEAFERAAKAQGLAVLLCGWRAGDGLKISEIQPRPNSQTLSLSWRGQEAQVDLPLIGEFQAVNAVTAAALALSLGEDPGKVFAAMETLQPVRGRIEHVGATADGAHVFVDYAHTPDGLDVLLRAARPHAPGRVVLVFGCGGDRDKGKRAKMGAIAAKFADVVIVTDDNPRSETPAAIRAEILQGCPGAKEIGDRGEAIGFAVSHLRAGDALLIAGKGHETGQIVGDRVVAFSDQDTARAALRERAA